MKKSLMLGMALVAAVSLTACGGDSPQDKIVGTWVFADENDDSTEFKDDGTGVADGNAFTWKLEGSESLTLNIYEDGDLKASMQVEFIGDDKMKLTMDGEEKVVDRID